MRIPTEHTILGIESSCDETSAAIISRGELASVIISSQMFHKDYGGIVPELASRAHTRSITPIVEESLTQAGITVQDISAIAVTYAPGLMGSLLVGLNFAKGASLALGIPVIGVHHIEAHIFSVLLEKDQPRFPFLTLIVSGGHTLLVIVRDVGEYQIIGKTLDDAAGEAFDKVGKMLDLGYPAGPIIDRLALDGNDRYVNFPRPMISDPNYDFSFSGIKTSVRYWLRDHAGAEQTHLNDIAASFQRAVVDVLVTKTLRAAAEYEIDDIVCVGGVSANSKLKKKFAEICGAQGKEFFSPRPLFSTDNAAMIAMLGALKIVRGDVSPLTLHAEARVSIGERQAQ